MVNGTKCLAHAHTHTRAHTNTK